MTSEVGFRHSQVDVAGSSLHVVEIGDPDATPVLFLHGWPQSWRSWQGVMREAVPHARAIAIDLPGIGRSIGDATDGSKRALAGRVHELVDQLGLSDLTLVGQDVGGVVTFAYLREFPGLARAVMLDVLVPGVDPWNKMLRNPYVWHIALHSIPGLPETLVQDRQRAYFDFFYDVLSADPRAISDEARADYAAAYSSEAALTAGFNWYRAFGADSAEFSVPLEVQTPVLYLRGDKSGTDLTAYVDGFRAAGLINLTHDVVPHGGHFAHEEAPAAVWQRIAAFAGF